MTGELLCERCGQNYVVWFAPNETWNHVMRGGKKGNREEFAFVCPTCFTFLAEVAHGLRPTAWEVRPEAAFPGRGAEGDPSLPLCPEPPSGVYCEHGIRTTRLCPICDPEAAPIEDEEEA